MKKITTLFALLFVAIACNAGAPKSDLDVAELTRGLWVHLDSEWQSSPAETGFTSSAYARILRFAPDGNFSWIACILLRSKRGIAISPGDGQVFFFGRWRSAGGQVTAEYLKVREMVHVVGAEQPFEKKQVASVEMRNGAVMFDGLRFTRSFAPQTKKYEEMVEGVRSYEADKIRPFFEKQ